eukprot:scaffold442_cov268-Pinguiococcus_pyrenoidosus.AAC.90
MYPGYGPPGAFPPPGYGIPPRAPTAPGVPRGPPAFPGAPPVGFPPPMPPMPPGPMFPGAPGMPMPPPVFNAAVTGPPRPPGMAMPTASPMPPFVKEEAKATAEQTASAMLDAMEGKLGLAGDAGEEEDPAAAAAAVAAAAPPPPIPQRELKVFVGGLPAGEVAEPDERSMDTTMDDFSAALFSCCGELKTWDRAREPVTKRMLTFARAVYVVPEAAIVATDLLDNMEVDVKGRKFTLSVKAAKEDLEYIEGTWPRDASGKRRCIYRSLGEGTRWHRTPDDTGLNVPRYISDPTGTGTSLVGGTDVVAEADLTNRWNLPALHRTPQWAGEEQRQGKARLKAEDENSKVPGLLPVPPPTEPAAAEAQNEETAALPEKAVKEEGEADETEAGELRIDESENGGKTEPAADDYDVEDEGEQDPQGSEDVGNHVLAKFTRKGRKRIKKLMRALKVRNALRVLPVAFGEIVAEVGKQASSGSAQGHGSGGAREEASKRATATASAWRGGSRELRRRERQTSDGSCPRKPLGVRRHAADRAGGLECVREETQAEELRGRDLEIEARTFFTRVRCLRSLEPSYRSPLLILQEDIRARQRKRITYIEDQVRRLKKEKAEAAKRALEGPAPSQMTTMENGAVGVVAAQSAPSGARERDPSGAPVPGEGAEPGPEPRAQLQDSARRSGVSNLPAWMTRGQGSAAQKAPPARPESRIPGFVAASSSQAEQGAETFHQRKKPRIDLGPGAHPGAATTAPIDGVRRTVPQRELSKEELRQLADSIPSSSDELFGLTVDWDAIQASGVLDTRIKDWVARKFSEYLGEADETMTTFVQGALQERSTPDAIIKELALVLEDDAEVFVTKLWRMVVFEAKRYRASVLPDLALQWRLVLEIFKNASSDPPQLGALSALSAL